MKPNPCALSLILFPLLPSAPAAAQAYAIDDLVFRLESGTGFFGSDAAHGDFNGDGVVDFAFAAPSADYVAIFSGVDGGLIFRLRGGSLTRFGQLVAFGQLDADPAAELVVYAQNLHRVIVYDLPPLLQGNTAGTWHADLPARTPAQSMTTVDTDGDGVDEVYLGYPRESRDSGALVQAVDAQNVSMIRGGAGDRLGAAMTAVPRRNGPDGLMVSAAGRHEVRVFDGTLTLRLSGALIDGNTGAHVLEYRGGRVLVAGADSNSYAGTWGVYDLATWTPLYGGTGTAQMELGRSGGFSVDGQRVYIGAFGQNSEGRIYRLDLATGAFQLHFQGDPYHYVRVLGNAVELYPGAGPDVFPASAQSIGRGMLMTETPAPLRVGRQRISLSARDVLPVRADFGPAHAGEQLLLFASVSGWGPTPFGRFELGITPDFVTSVGPWPGSGSPRALDAQGRAAFDVTFPVVAVRPFTLLFCGVVLGPGTVTAATDYGLGVRILN